MFTFRQLTLQCCHHSLTQFHSPCLQFIQNQALVGCLSHQLHARYHYPRKVYTQCFRNKYFFDKPSYFHRFERQNNAVGSDGVLPLHGKEIRFETSFSLAVFFWEQKQSWRNKGLVPRAVWAQLRGVRALFCVTECVESVNACKCSCCGLFCAQIRWPLQESSAWIIKFWNVGGWWWCVGVICSSCWVDCGWVLMAGWSVISFGLNPPGWLLIHVAGLCSLY